MAESFRSTGPEDSTTALRQKIAENLMTLVNPQEFTSTTRTQMKMKNQKLSHYTSHLLCSPQKYFNFDINFQYTEAESTVKTGHERFFSYQP